MRFESILCMKIAKIRLLKKSLQRRKLRARFCLSPDWLHISVKKLLKTAILLVQKLRISEKQFVLGPTLN